MKAISLTQPWAHLVVTGAKQFETRSWGTKYRGELLIHATANAKNVREIGAKKPFKDFIPYWTQLSYGAIIGKVTLVNVYRVEVLRGHLSDQEAAFGDYNTGRYAWELKDPVKFDKPISYKGSLGIWEFPDDLLQEKR